jgi:hypothetical protein
MRVSLFSAGLLAVANAASVPESAVEVRDGGLQCPSVWKSVKAELNTLFMTGNQCNDKARAAIRAIFHDCGSWDTTQGFTGGCDGSLILGSDANGRELDRPENRGLQGISVEILRMAAFYGTTVADMIVFAGSKFHQP